MTIQSKSEIIQLLEESEAAIQKMVGSVSETDFQHKPTENQWSIAELVEHIILVEKGVLGKLQQLLAQPQAQAIPAPAAKDTFVEILSNRNRKVPAPEHFVPKNIFSNKSMALQAFKEHRAHLAKFVNTPNLPLEKVGFPHFAFGMLNGEYWIRFMAGHCLRHVEQMATNIQ